ncbi:MULTISPECIES: hypothetical protein [Cupriavidus]
MRPAQLLAQLANEWHWDTHTLQGKREALSSAYMHAAFEDPETLAVFAHGDELVRARRYHGMAAVETYNIHVQGWDRRAIELYAWDAIAAAASRYAHPDGRNARAFFALPIRVLPEADGSLPVTPLYDCNAVRAQGFGVFEQVEERLHLVAAYHRGYEERARILACELLVADEAKAADVEKHLTAQASHDLPTDSRRITSAEFAVFAEANSAPRGTKFESAFASDTACAWPAYLPADPQSPAYGVADFHAFAGRPELLPVVSDVARTASLGLSAATSNVARALFDYVSPARELDAQFDVAAFDAFRKQRKAYRLKAAPIVSAAAEACAL